MIVSPKVSGQGGAVKCALKLDPVDHHRHVCPGRPPVQGMIQGGGTARCFMQQSL
jgi:hypothetical protein